MLSSINVISLRAPSSGGGGRSPPDTGEETRGPARRSDLSPFTGEVGAGAPPPADGRLPSSTRVFPPQSNAPCLGVSGVAQVSARRELTLQHAGGAEGTRSSHPWEGEGGHACIYAPRSSPR